MTGAIHIHHAAKEKNILELIQDILQRVYKYNVKTYNMVGGNVTAIDISELSELAGPIPPEFLTNK